MTGTYDVLMSWNDGYGLMQDCGNSSAFALELLQSCAKLLKKS